MKDIIQMNINANYMEIRTEDLNLLINNVKKERTMLDNMISPFMNESFSDKENLELCQTGKFLSKLNGFVSILKKRESPDFLISYNNDPVGLEHELILSEDRKSKKYRSIKKLFRDAAILFANKYPEYKILVNVYLNDNNFSFKKHEMDSLKNEIADCIYNSIKQKDFPKSSFISEVLIFNHSRVSFVYNPGPGYVESINRDHILKAIRRKESKIDKYIKKTGVNRQWLLLAIGTVEPDSFEFNKCFLEKEIKSRFEHIFILEDFNNTLHKIK